jgi:hypothetical protein
MLQLAAQRHRTRSPGNDHVSLASPFALGHNHSTAANRVQSSHCDAIWTRATLVRLGVVLCLIPLHFYVPNLGLLLRGLIEVALVFEARYSNLVPLAVNTLYWQSFREAFKDIDGADGVVADASGLEGYAYLAGIIAMIVRFLLFRNANLADGVIRKFDGRFVIFSVIVALGALSSLRGYVIGTRGWSSNLRSTLTIGAFFYGAMLGVHYDQRLRIARSFCVPIGLALYQAINVGFIQSRLAWTLGPFVSAGAVYSLFFPLGVVQWLCAMAAFASSLQMTCIASATSTITLLTLWIGGTAAGLATSVRRFYGLPYFRVLLKALVVASAFMPLVIVQSVEKAEWSYVSRNEDFFGYARLKLFGDRGELWAWTLELFSDRPLIDKLLAPGGTTIRDTVIDAGGRRQTITMGAHNVYLDAIFTLGIIPGGLLIIFLLYNCWSVINGITVCRDPDIALLGYGSIAVLLLGGFTGMFMIHQDGGTWFYFLTGIVLGASARAQSLPRRELVRVSTR